VIQYYRSYPYGRHDPYLPSIPASLQTLGRVECATTYAVAPLDPRTDTPLILTLISQCRLDACKKLTPECLHLSSHNARILPVHTRHDPCLLSTLISLPPPRHECSSISFPRLRVCQTLNSRLPPRFLRLRVYQTINPCKSILQTDRSVFRQQFHSVDV
jgi:hypothetical protein